jgi:hypothetical protein
LPKVKGLANKIYEFFQKKKSLPRKDIGFDKREKFSQNKI